MKWFHCIRYADVYGCQMWLHTYNRVYVLPCVVVEMVQFFVFFLKCWFNLVYDFIFMYVMQEWQIQRYMSHMKEMERQSQNLVPIKRSIFQACLLLEIGWPKIFKRSIVWYLTQKNIHSYIVLILKTKDLLTEFRLPSKHEQELIGYIFQYY